MSIIVVIDIGTTRAKTCAFDTQGRILATGSCQLKAYLDRHGYYVHRPNQWWEATVTALQQMCRTLAERTREIATIGLTGQCPSFTLLHETHGPLAEGWLYADNRAVHQSQFLISQLGATDIHQRTGQAASPFFIFPKLLWLQDQFLITLTEP